MSTEPTTNVSQMASHPGTDTGSLDTSSPTVDHRARSAASPYEIVVLGAEGAGKTSFLAGLAVLGEADRPGGVVVRGDDPPSQSFLHDLGSALRRRRFPPSTTATRSITATIVHRGRLLRVGLVDFAGEGFRTAATAGQLERMPLLVERLRSADAIVLMLDPTIDLGVDAVEANSAERADAVQDRYAALLLALMDAIEQATGDEQAARRSPPRVAIVLTKADRYPGELRAGGAEGMLARRLPAFMERIRRWSRSPGVFAISSVGAVETMKDDAGTTHVVPAAVLAPSGYDELLDWMIVGKRARDRAPTVRRTLWIAGVVAAVLVIAVTSIVLLRRERERALRDPATSVDAIARMPVDGLTGPSRAVLDERLDAELAAIARRLEAGPTLLALRESIVPELEQLEPITTGDRGERRARLLDDARRRLHDAWAAELLARSPEPAPSSLRSFIAEVAAFRQAFPSSERLAAITGHQTTFSRLVDASLRRRVAEIRWDPSRPERGAEFLLSKAAAVDAYANDPLALLDAAQRAERRAAAAAARVLAETRDWALTIESIGPFGEGRHAYVSIDRVESSTESSSRSASEVRPLWRWESRQQATRHRPGLRDGGERVLQLRPGDRVSVSVGIGTRGPWLDGWWGGTGFARIPASAPEPQPLSLRFLSGTFRLASFPHDKAWTEAFGDASIELTLRPLGGEPFTAATWDLLQRHIAGDGE